jgi:hypothetical protein
MCLGLVITFALNFIMGKARKQGTFPKCEALDEAKVLYFGNVSHTQDPYT